MEHSFTALLKAMLEFQKINNIKGKCITNCQYFKDICKMNQKKVKFKAVIAYKVKDEEQEILFFAHMVIDLGNGDLVDCSYETFQHDMQYFEKLLQVPYFAVIESQSRKQMVDNFLQMLKAAERINTDDDYACLEEEYYEKQHNYIKEKLNLND